MNTHVSRYVDSVKIEIIVFVSIDNKLYVTILKVDIFLYEVEKKKGETNLLPRSRSPKRTKRS